MPLLSVPDVHAPLLTWAQWYGEHAWSVFPCRGKTPLTPHGFHDATCDPFQIEIWWRQWPDANIGTPMGDGRFALDIDPRAGGDDTLFALERQHGALPHTLLSHTGGGGNHYLYLEPPGGIMNKAALGQGIDVQGRGSYIIVPPSMHPDTGRPYLWDVVDGPEDIDLQPAPGWLLALLTAPAGPVSGHTSAAPLVPGAKIPVGKRDTTLAQFAGGLRRAGASVAEIRAALEVRNQWCEVPLDGADLDRIARSIGRYDPLPQMHTGTPAPLTTNGTTPHGADPQDWGTPRTKLQLIDLADMLKKTYPLPRWLIAGLIPEGLTFFVGKPKSSKTYLAYSLALSLVMSMQRESQWLGYYDILNKGPVVYITLEDDEAESWHRILELEPGLKDLPPSRFLFHHGIDFPHLGADLVTVVKEDIIDVYRPSLIVLDPISYLYAPTKKGADQFSDVKDMLLPLRWLGKEHHLSILGVDHRRKTSVDDVDIFESTYGSNAKIAVADALLMIVRDVQEITLHSKVRKAEEQTITLGFTFDASGRAIWEWKGAVNGLLLTGQYGDLRQKLIEALSGFQQPMSIADMLAALQIPDSRAIRNNLYQLLFRAQKSGEVQKTTKGQYVWAGGN